MADISVTDQLQLSGNLTISDDSPFALSKLKNLNFSSLPVVGDFAKPVNECSFEEASVGMALSSPAMLLASAASLVVTAGENAAFFVRTEKSKQLFDSDGFTPDIAIGPGQCWVGLELATTVGEKFTGQIDGFGVSLTNATEVRFGSHILLGPASFQAGSMPTLQQALKMVLEKFSIGATAGAIQNQEPGTVRTIATTGKVCVSASYCLPVAIDPLATVNLPFQFKLNIQPGATVQLTGALSLTGEFVIRCHRSTPTNLIIGLYKKKETVLSASFAAAAGVGVDLGSTDVLTPVLNAVVPKPDLAALRLDDDQAKELKSALKSCVDQSFSVAMNARCSAGDADEAAVVYSIDLTQAHDQTNRALAAALRSDWSALASLPNAKEIRNIVRETEERKHRVNINLLGLLNATSIRDYLSSSTVLHDGNGQIVLVDKVAAKSLSATDTPYAAKPDKLRAALAQAFVATISYGAAGGKLAIKSFTVRQSYLDFKLKPGAQDVRKYVLLGRCLGLRLDESWNAFLQGTSFDHAKCYADAQYAEADVMRIFYADPDKRLPRTQAQLDKIGCDTKLALLDPATPTAAPRRMALSTPAIWNAMTSNGNVANFRFIDGLSRLPQPALAAVSADWVDVRWWADAMQRIPAKLTAVLEALDVSTTGNPLDDKTFMARQKELQGVLADVTAKAQSAFGDGWGMAVIRACAGGSPATQMDICCNQKVEHYEIGAGIAAVA